MTPNFADMTLAEMAHAWNAMVPAAAAAGLDVTPRNRFSDKPSAIQALQKLSRSLARVTPAPAEAKAEAEAVPPTPPAPEAKAEPVPSAEPTIKATKKRGYAPDARVEVLAATNPKKPTSRAHTAFALYKIGMTVADFVAEVGSEREANAHLAWDIKHGFIRLT